MPESTDEIIQIIQLMEIKLEQMKTQIERLKTSVGMSKIQRPLITRKDGRS